METTHHIAKCLVTLSFLFITSMHALDSEGNISVAGFVETDLNDLRDTLFSVTQYNASGIINTHFGDRGLATLPFRHGIAMDVKTQVENDEDKIVVVGTAIDPAVGLPRAIIARFMGTGAHAGQLDTSFNTNGAIAPGNSGFVWLAPAPSVANSIEVSSPNSLYFVCGSLIQNRRYRGFFQTITFGGTITSLIAFPADTQCNTLSQKLPFFCAGKSIVCGTPRPIFMSIEPPVSIDFTADISGEFLDCTISNDNDNIAYCVGTHANKGLLVKLNTNTFEIDTSFGSNGYVIAEFSNQQTAFNAIKIDSSTDLERIFVCGTTRGLQNHMFIAEYDANGNLVPTFGKNGIMTIFEGPYVQTIARDLLLPESLSCPSGSSTGMFALGAANGRTPILANLNCSDGSLKKEYGDKAIASLETEALTSMTVLKEVEPTGGDLPIPNSSPFTRELNTLFGNPFAVSLTGSGTGTGFVLPPGRYYVDAQAPMQDVVAHQLALYNDRKGVNEVFGDSIWNSSGILTKALLKGQLFVADSTKYILRHYFTGDGPSFAVGNPASIAGLEEIYTQMNIQQL